MQLPPALLLSAESERLDPLVAPQRFEEGGPSACGPDGRGGYRKHLEIPVPGKGLEETAHRLDGLPHPRGLRWPFRPLPRRVWARALRTTRYPTPGVI